MISWHQVLGIIFESSHGAGVSIHLLFHKKPQILSSQLTPKHAMIGWNYPNRQPKETPKYCSSFKIYIQIHYYAFQGLFFNGMLSNPHIKSL